MPSASFILSYKLYIYILFNDLLTPDFRGKLTNDVSSIRSAIERSIKREKNGTYHPSPHLKWMLSLVNFLLI